MACARASDFGPDSRSKFGIHSVWATIGKVGGRFIYEVHREMPWDRGRTIDRRKNKPMTNGWKESNPQPPVRKAPEPSHPQPRPGPTPAPRPTPSPHPPKKG